ncbi:hypothetical protein ACIU1J_23540 [Azospirillum doebereinerae]|uniref:hypothetical protein n=1 Tax=Azospirillum doebereinerae TaxID=92933 RepID=UPI001EE53C3D|nr:hypothetical protein [Azospirillum doebereinerae]MCG5238755.1 hypothetical protein [Azospirillum doebereinerae]
MSPRLTLPLLGLTCLTWALAAPPAATAAGRDPDWPCVQILVPTLSPGQIWAGDPVEGKEGAWRDVPGLEPVLKQALDRSADEDRTEAAIGRFADTLGVQRNEVLTVLFAAVFDTLNRERGEAIAAIQRYARQQHALLDRIDEGLTRLRELPQTSPEAEALAADIAWQRRILDERRRYQSAMCDQPVRLEQRLGRIARAIAAHLD